MTVMYVAGHTCTLLSQESEDAATQFAPSAALILGSAFQGEITQAKSGGGLVLSREWLKNWIRLTRVFHE